MAYFLLFFCVFFKFFENLKFVIFYKKTPKKSPKIALFRPLFPP